jgi:hypothetical protein
VKSQRSRENYIIIKDGNNDGWYVFSSIALQFGENISVASRYNYCFQQQNIFDQTYLHSSNFILTFFGHLLGFSVDLEHLSVTENSRHGICCDVFLKSCP